MTAAKPKITSTFYQSIGDKKHRITVPQTRITTIIDRVDALVHKKQLDKALKVIKPFITADREVTMPQRASRTVGNPSDRKQRVGEILADMAGRPDIEVIRALRDEFGMTYANARYYVKKQAND